MRAPFPWFGGKSRAASIVWDAFGDVPNYIEPFAGSLAVLLARPHVAQIETVNDLDCYLANFWRAVSKEPAAVAEAADWPVNETDLDARHLWLVQRAEFRELMRNDPDYYDARVAGYWVWGLCAWIGGGFCGVEKYLKAQSVEGNAGQGISRKLPHLGNAGRGINRKLPHLGDAGQGINQLSHAEDFAAQFHALQNRLRKTRVICGSWERAVTDSLTWRHGVTGILLDPPYVDGDMKYVAGHEGVSDSVTQWAVANGRNPLLRIALCGYEGEREMPATWRKVEWKAGGGYGGDNGNPARERIWFSPHCLNTQPSLFGAPL